MKYLLIVIFLSLSLAVPLSVTVHAQNNISIINPARDTCIDTGNCGVCDIMRIVLHGFELILALLGAVGFLVFFYGAFELIFARGNPEKIEKGKEWLKGSIWGMLFVLISWQLVNIVFWVLTGTGTPQRQKGFSVFGNPWNYTDCSFAVPEKAKSGQGLPY